MTIQKSPWFIPSCLFILAFSLRFWGVGFGLPFLYHADEPIVVNHALAYGAGDLNPHFFNIPPLLSYVLFVVYGLYFVVGKILGVFSSVSSFENFFYEDPSSFYFLGRLIFGVIMGSASVMLLYRGMKKHIGELEGAIGAVLLATCFIHARDSHYIYPDVPLTALFIIAMFYLINHFIDKSEKLRHHVIFGALVGVATAMKYNGCLIAVPYVFLAFSQSRSMSQMGKMFLAGVISLATFYLLNPFALLDHPTFLAEIIQESAAHQGGLPLLRGFLYPLAGAFGGPILCFAFIGLFFSSQLGKGKYFAVLSFVVIYLIAIKVGGQPYPRYFTPLSPFFCFFAAIGIVCVSRRVVRGAQIFLVAVVFIAISFPLTKTILFNSLMSQQDTRTQAKELIESSAKSNSKIALDIPFYMPRLNVAPTILEQNLNALKMLGNEKSGRARRAEHFIKHTEEPYYEIFQMTQEPKNQEERNLFDHQEIQFDLDELSRLGVTYVVTSQVHKNPPHVDFYEELGQEAELLALLSPYKDKRDIPVEHPITGGPFSWKDLIMRERNGQPLKIYRLS